MFVIGINEFEFLKVTRKVRLYDYEISSGVTQTKKESVEVAKVKYDADLDEASMFKNYEDAKATVKEIQDNIENIKFENQNDLLNILDENDGFNKKKYSKQLKIYELEPVFVSEKSACER